MGTRAVSCIAAALTCAVALPAQAGNENEDAPKAVDRTPLVLAIGALDNAKTLLLSGKVAKESDGGFGGGVMVMSAGAGQGAEPFAGAVEVYRPKKGETLIVSKSGLPGVAVYESDDQRITRTTVDEGPVDTKTLSKDIGALLGFAKVQRAIQKAKKCELSIDEESGTRTYEVVLGKRLIRAGGSGFAMFQPKVLGITGRFVIDAEGKLEKMRFAVLRSDPMAMLRQKALSGEQIDPTEAMADAEDDETEGATSTYDFVVESGEPSKRARATLEALRKLSID